MVRRYMTNMSEEETPQKTPRHKGQDDFDSDDGLGVIMPSSPLALSDI